LSCSVPFDAFRQATESLPDEIYYRASYRGIWINLIQREEFRSGTGLTQSVFTLGRSEPTSDEPEFQIIALTDGENYTGSCGVDYQDVPVGFNEATYVPERFGWRGPTICQDDLIFSWKAQRFLEGYIPAITKNTKRTIENRLTAIYAHFVPKAVANTDFAYGNPGTGTPPQSPDLTLDESLCELTQEMLDTTAAILNEEGASDANSNGWINLGEDGPVYPLYIGQEASARILLNNAELRQDYRFAFEAAKELNPVIMRMGAAKVIKNFRHIINLFPPRYTYGGGAYTRVPTWIMPNGTKGQVADVNPAWRTAPFEAAFVLSPWVFISEIIRPVNSAAGLNWMPKNYMGDWTFITGGVNITPTGDCFDPVQKLGAHFAEYDHAPRPVFPVYGRMIIFNRCPQTTYECVSCS